MQMQHVINNTKNNMFKDKHPMWKTIAVVLCIKIQRTKSNLLRIYTYIYIHIYIYTTYTYIYLCIYAYTYTIHMHIAMSTCIYTMTHIHIKLVFNVFTHYVGLFSFDSTKLRKSYQIQRPFLF